MFAEQAAEVARAAGLSVTVMDREAIEAARLGGLLGVNRGSALPPTLLQISHEPDRPKGHLALVGKGITFDSGGLSLKTADGMIDMKSDMGGAAAVLAAMTLLPDVAPRLKATAFLPLTDNMVGPDATRVGDVLSIRNGKTVEVLNTDAEGRLILADGLSLASEAAPDAIVDCATLTGACMVALGRRTAGLMGNHQGWLDQVRAAADEAGEAVWPLPMPRHLRKGLDSDIADLRNIGKGRYGGALTAALFLEEFVADGIPWAHIDMAGPAFADEADGEVPKGGTGFGVRLAGPALRRLEEARPAITAPSGGVVPDAADRVRRGGRRRGLSVTVGGPADRPMGHGRMELPSVKLSFGGFGVLAQLQQAEREPAGPGEPLRRFGRAELDLLPATVCVLQASPEDASPGGGSAVAACVGRRSHCRRRPERA